MKEEYVTYECAVKLKELGFDWKCTHFYTCPTSKMLCESTTLLGFKNLSDFEHNFNTYTQNNHRQPAFNPYLHSFRGFSLIDGCVLMIEWLTANGYTLNTK